MALAEQNKPDDKKPMDGKDAPGQVTPSITEINPPEKPAVEASHPAKEDKMAALPIVKDGAESPANDTLLSHIVNGVKEIIPQKEKEPQKSVDVKDPLPDKAAGHKNPPVAEKAAKPITAEKSKPAAVIGGAITSAQKEKPPALEQPPAPRKGKAEKVVYINLSERIRSILSASILMKSVMTRICEIP